jgi:hypothetical protein
MSFPSRQPKSIFRMMVPQDGAKGKTPSPCCRYPPTLLIAKTTIEIPLHVTITRLYLQSEAADITATRAFQVDSLRWETLKKEKGQE